METVGKQEILLEAGTNELEIVEFSIGESAYAVNALKIKQFIVFDPENINPIPDSDSSVVGSILYQEQAVPVVDMANLLKIDKKQDSSRQVLLFCEFNANITAYIVDNVYKIQRVSWTDIKSLGADIVTEGGGKSVGVVVIEGRQITMLDFEQINAQLFRNELEEVNARISDHSTEVESKKERGQVKILYAEDSKVYLKAIPEFFTHHGYNQIAAFENGQLLYDHLIKLESDELPDVIVTDIEMPMMDGLTLCKKIKDLHPNIKVMVVSSLISEQMKLKCQSVSADSYLVKKDVAKLIRELDQLFC